MRNEKGLFIITIIASVIMLCGVFWGMNSYYYIIAILILASIGTLIYQHHKDKSRKRKKKVDDIAEDWQTIVLTVTAILIIVFLLVGLGNCIGSCTKGGGDTRQQRIEMGLPPY